MLLEREAELRLLQEVVEGLSATGGKVVLLRGEAGIGKSALVAELVRVCPTSVRVLQGACDDLFIPMPLAPFWDMAREAPSLRSSLQDGDRARFMRALEDILADDRPTLVVVEDTHWADEATLDAIRFVGRRIRRARAAIVLTYRDGDLDDDHPLRSVIGDLAAGDVVRVRLGGLTQEAVARLVAGSGLDPASVFDVTDGNPLLVREMAAVSSDGALLSLPDAVRSRLRRLTVGAQEALKTLAVLPEPVSRSHLLGVAGIDDRRLDEGLRRDLLREDEHGVAFRHELIRNVIEASLTPGERLARHRAVLAGLSEEMHPSVIIGSAVAADDVHRLLAVAPSSARYAAAIGSHQEAVRDFRAVGPYLERLDLEERATIIEEWAREEFLTDHVSEAVRLGEMAREHHHARGDHRSESAALARLAQYLENDGQRARAEAVAQEAVDVLGDEPDGSALALALEGQAYLAMMAGNVRAVPELVARTLAAGGPELDEVIRIRSLNHSGIVANIADYPDGRAALDEAHRRSELAEQWFEAGRALGNQAWAAAEAHDLPLAEEYAERAVATAVRHELLGLETYARALQARVFELEGRWDEASDLARELSDGTAITRMVALPIVAAIETRRGRASATDVLAEAWALVSPTVEFQRLAPVAIPAAEHAWLTGHVVATAAELESVMVAGLELGFRWSPGKVAAWLWRMGELRTAPEGIAQPFRSLIGGDVTSAAASLEEARAPYERALLLMHGNVAQRLEALEAFETLGATAVASKLRRTMREEGLSVPRGRGRATRRHAVGLTGRQAEVLALLGDGCSNVDIADRLFVSRRTVESHVAAILDRFDSASREEAVAKARQAGLLPLADT